MINPSLSDLLWRRYYEAKVDKRLSVPLLPETLKALLVQAGIPEPEDDEVISSDGERWSGRVYQMVPKNKTEE